MMALLFAFVICFSFAGCSLQDKIKEYSSDKEQCYLNAEDVTQFSCKGNDYTILEDTVSNGGPGEWIGYIRQLTAVDETGKVLLQENLITDVNGEYHKAVRKETIKDTDTVFDFRDTEPSMSGRFEINPDNATQLLCDGMIYQVTSDTVSNDELGSYIDILAESVTFDTETKRPLSKENLSKIDWDGKNAGQGREQWFYTDVYEIYGTDKTEAVAVKINNCYYIAEQK